MERDYEWSSAVHFDDLMAPPRSAAMPASSSSAGSTRARRRARACRWSTTAASRAACSATSAGAINGRAVARGTSFLKDKMGEQIFAKGIRILDNPHAQARPGQPAVRRRGPADQAPRRDRRRRAHHLAARPRGRAPAQAEADRPCRARHVGPPSPTTSNFYLEKGKLSVDELIADIKSGLYITDLIGFGVNGVTGDYSRGASGFWIENGKQGLAGERHHGGRQSQGHVPQHDAGQRPAVQELDQCADGANRRDDRRRLVIESAA